HFLFISKDAQEFGEAPTNNFHIPRSWGHIPSRGDPGFTLNEIVRVCNLGQAEAVPFSTL
ncbi:unnamed protein product, partial [Ilex paraguariensis]